MAAEGLVIERIKMQIFLQKKGPLLVDQFKNYPHLPEDSIKFFFNVTRRGQKNRHIDIATNRLNWPLLALGLPVTPAYLLTSCTAQIREGVKKTIESVIIIIPGRGGRSAGGDHTLLGF